MHKTNFMYAVIFYVWISVCRGGRRWSAPGPLLGISSAGFGRLLGRSCAVLGPPGASWGFLGPPGASWGCSWTASGRPPACCSWRLWLLLSAPGCSWRLVAAPGRVWRSWPLVCVFLAAAAGLLAASGFVISFRDKYRFQVRMRTRMYKSMYLCIIQLVVIQVHILECIMKY